MLNTLIHNIEDFFLADKIQRYKALKAKVPPNLLNLEQMMINQLPASLLF